MKHWKITIVSPGTGLISSVSMNLCNLKVGLTSNSGCLPFLQSMGLFKNSFREFF